MLTAGEIAQMQSVCETTFDSTCVVQGGTITGDTGGGGTLAWVASGTVDCHLSPFPARGEREGVTGGRISKDADWILTIPADTNITQASRVVVDGTAYEVEAVRAPRTWELTRRVELSEAT